MNGNAEKQMIKEVLLAEELLSEKYCHAVSRCVTPEIRNKLIFAHDEVQQSAGMISDEAVSRGWLSSIKADKQTVQQAQDELNRDNKQN